MRPRLLKPILLASALTLLLIALVQWQARTHLASSQAHHTQMVLQVKEVLKLALSEIHVSQVYEIKKGNLSVLSMPIPFTNQKSLIIAEGVAMLGYDLCNVKVDLRGKEVTLDLPHPSILSLDLDYRVVYENDYVLNRITPDDRNEMLMNIKNEIKKTLISESRKMDLAERTKKLVEAISQKLRVNVVLNS